MNLQTIDNKTGTVEGFALVKSCDKKNAKNGTVYLDIVLADKESELVAKLWDFKDGVQREVEANTIVKVRGLPGEYNGTPQLKIERIRPISPTDEVEMSDFVPSAEYTGEYMLANIQKTAENFKNEELKRLVAAFLDKYKEGILDCPAAFRLHHAVRGGLLYHTLSMIKLAEAVIALYPSVDGDLLLAGVILHDILKTKEFNIAKTGLVDSYSLDGFLIGHLVMGAMEVKKLGEELEISADTLRLAEHMIISHHGVPEFGAAVRPLFLEAEILSQIDLMDARIYEIEKAVEDVKPGEFSTKQWALEDRRFLNHGRKPVKTVANL